MKKILVVDDEMDFCILMKETLEIMGNYKVIIANNGKKALQMAKSSNPDLILLDINMPIMDGLTALRILKQDEKTTHIPVVMLTVRSEKECQEEATALYDEDYLVKPVQIEDLRSTIERILSNKSTEIRA